MELYGPTSLLPTSFTEYGSGKMHPLIISQDVLSVRQSGLQLSFEFENSCEDSCVVGDEADDDEPGEKGESSGKGGSASLQ